MAAVSRPDVRHRRSVQITIAVVALFALLPLGYVFNGFWASTRDAERFNVVQRAGVDYIRPLTALLATLVNAQGAAVRGDQVPADAVRKALTEVGRVDRESGDPLRIRSRWSQLSGEIESALRQSTSGSAAMRTYAAPIGLTQALLRRIGDVSMMIRDPQANVHYLVETAVVGVPEVIVNAGQIIELSGSAATVDPRTVVALDRISRAAQAISAGPRSGVDGNADGPGTMNMLAPLDEFTAATDGLVQAASKPDLSAGRPLDDLNRARSRLQQAALGLGTAALDSVTTLLEQRVDEFAAQRRNILIAGILLLVAAAALLWWVWPTVVGLSRLDVARSERFPPTDDVPNARAGVVDVGHSKPLVLSKGPR